MPPLTRTMSALDEAPSPGARPGQDSAHGASGAPSREGTTPVSTPSQPGSAPHGSFHKTRTSCNPATTAIHCNNRFTDLAYARISRNSFRNKVVRQRTHFLEILIGIKCHSTTVTSNPIRTRTKERQQLKRHAPHAQHSLSPQHCRVAPEICARCPAVVLVERNKPSHTFTGAP